MRSARTPSYHRPCNTSDEGTGRATTNHIAIKQQKSNCDGLCCPSIRGVCCLDRCRQHLRRIPDYDAVYHDIRRRERSLAGCRGELKNMRL